MKKFFTLEKYELILKVAACLHVAVGLFMAIFPRVSLEMMGIETTAGIEFLQIIGLAIVGAGISYFCVRTDLPRFWPILLVGMFSAFSTAVLFTKILLMEGLPFGVSLFILVASVVWMMILTQMLKYAYEVNIAEPKFLQKFDDILGKIRTSQNKDLFELSKDRPILLMVVRHLGCVFCKETVAELSKIENVLREKNITPVFVHMSDPDFGDEFFSKYYPGPVHHISDPARSIYRSLNLQRANFYQMFGPLMWLRTLQAGVIKGHGLISQFEGDIHQMGGMFVLLNGKIISEHKAESAHQHMGFNNLPQF